VPVVYFKDKDADELILRKKTLTKSNYVQKEKATVSNIKHP
jgi:hypothetical protein